MKAFEMAEVLAQRAMSGRPSFEFLRARTLSLHAYVLPAGGPDPQHPHGEDEVYFIVSGRATIVVGDEERAVQAGSIVFVPAHTPHRFLSIIEPLEVLVVFAPPRSGT
jgi:mannose-6-phosphate isomerase-like protein (cupin superfamily)